MLLEHWDPLGVADVDYAPEQEYLTEAQHVVAQLLRYVDVDAVAALLASAGLGSDGGCDRRAAVEVVSWWETKGRHASKDDVGGG